MFIFIQLSYASFRPLIGVTISNFRETDKNLFDMMVSVPLSGLPFLILIYLLSVAYPASVSVPLSGLPFLIGLIMTIRERKFKVSVPLSGLPFLIGERR